MNKELECLEAVHTHTHTCNLKEKGVTLVALVVTIVVLLILAGVTINLVVGQNGLISKAKEARGKMQNAEANEKTSMDSTSDWILEVANGTELPQTNETKPYMPGDGFTKVEGTNLANGLTIQDSDGNQYVWVEVPMTEIVYPTAKLGITEFNEDEYTKIENDLHAYTMTYRKEKNEEETTFKDVWYEDITDQDDWYTSEQYTKQKQKMLKSVYQNGGFWVARYEAGLTEENRRNLNSSEPTVVPKSEQNLIPYTHITRTQAKKVAEMVQYTKNEKVYKGSLMFGVQWDLMLKFIENKTIKTDASIVSKLNFDSTSIGNYKNNQWNITNTSAKYSINYGITFFACPYKRVLDEDVLLTTGADNSFALMNIYDIAGNVFEWTLEYTANKNYPCTNRGSYCYSEGSGKPASCRNISFTSNNGDSGFGFRISLY